jgi:hypothetical protein
MGNHRRSREQRSQGSGGEYCSKFHSASPPGEIAMVSVEIPHEDQYEAGLMPVSGGKKVAKNQEFRRHSRPDEP